MNKKYYISLIPSIIEQERFTRLSDPQFLSCKLGTQTPPFITALLYYTQRCSLIFSICLINKHPHSPTLTISNGDLIGSI